MSSRTGYGKTSRGRIRSARYWILELERRVCPACYGTQRTANGAMATPENGALLRSHEMKDASTRACLEPTVSAAHLAAAITTAASMGIKERERVSDRIYAAQPNLLSSVLAQRSLGVSMPTIDVLLNILIVLYLAIEKSGQVLAIDSKANQERELRRFIAAFRFTEGLGSDTLAQSIEQTTACRREKFLFAYVIDILQRAGLTDLQNETSKYPSLVAIQPSISSTASRPQGARRPQY